MLLASIPLTTAHIPLLSPQIPSHCKMAALMWRACVSRERGEWASMCSLGAPALLGEAAGVTQCCVKVWSVGCFWEKQKIRQKEKNTHGHTSSFMSNLSAWVSVGQQWASGELPALTVFGLRHGHTVKSFSRSIVSLSSFWRNIWLKLKFKFTGWVLSSGSQ